MCNTLHELQLGTMCYIAVQQVRGGSSNSYLPLEPVHPQPQLYVLVQPAVALHCWYAAAAAAAGAAAVAVAADIMWQQLRHAVCRNPLHQLLVYCVCVSKALPLLLAQAYALDSKPADINASMYCI
jgi:hypothetical protein